MPQFQDSEIVDLLMVVFLTPVMLAILPKIRMAGKRWFVFGYFSIVAGFVFTLAETVVWPDFLNVLEHWAYAAAGCCFTVGISQLSRSAHTEDAR